MGTSKNWVPTPIKENLSFKFNDRDSGLINFSRSPYGFERGGFDMGHETPSTASDEPAVEVSSLAKAYGREQAVFSDVQLSVQPGERVALIGVNGSGKSTLLKCIIGLHASSAGTVTALGETFTGYPGVAQRLRIRKKTGFVFQHHGLVKRLSVLSNVVHGMLGYPGSWRATVQTLAPSVWREDAMRALEAVALSDKAMHRADALSGGQQQRVAIARALIRKPVLIIADEPAASLDPAAGRDIMDVFSNLVRNEGITLLFTSHDMEHAVTYSDRIVALKHGGVFFDKPSSAVTDEMLAEVFV